MLLGMLICSHNSHSSGQFESPIRYRNGVAVVTFNAAIAYARKHGIKTYGLIQAATLSREEFIRKLRS
jgi:hypothetical protein